MRAAVQLDKSSDFHERYCSWAEMLRRVFAIDLLERSHCQGSIKILAQSQPPDLARKILRYIGPPSEPPPIALASRNPQASLPLDPDVATPLD